MKEWPRNRWSCTITLTHRVSKHSYFSKKEALPLSAISKVVLERWGEEQWRSCDINDRSHGDIYVFLNLYMTAYELIIPHYLQFSILTLGIKNHCSRALQLTKYIPDSYHIWFPLWKSYSNPISIWSTWGSLTFLKPSNCRISKFRHPHSEKLFTFFILIGISP